jgi:hypothetical protein
MGTPNIFLPPYLLPQHSHIQHHSSRKVLRPPNRKGNRARPRSSPGEVCQADPDELPGSPLGSS